MFCIGFQRAKKLLNNSAKVMHKIKTLAVLVNLLKIVFLFYSNKDYTTETSKICACAVGFNSKALITTELFFAF